MNHLSNNIFLILLLFLTSSCGRVNPSGAYFKIKVVDETSGQGLPMVALTAMNKTPYYTDSQGYIAFSEEGLMGQEVYFTIKSPGYSYPLDTAGRSGITLPISAGGSIEIALKRHNLAKRLYRITGSGIYRDSRLLGLSTPIEKPSINAGVFGQDSNLSTIYKGKVFWIWGDTFLPHQYIGNFSVSGATSNLSSSGGLLPSVGVDLQYFVDEKGYSKNMIEPQGSGYVWFDWLMNIEDNTGAEQLVAKYARVNAYFGNYERGVAVFNDEKEIFERFQKVEGWLDEPHVCHHPFKGKSKGQEYYYITGEFNFSRVQPNLSDLAQPAQYDYFTCLLPGETFDNPKPKVERDQNGKLLYGWKKQTDAVDYTRQEQLVKKGSIQASERIVQLFDINTGIELTRTRGSIHWNEFRQRWILITGNTDIYFAEADTPVGPWGYARRVAENDNFFYNPLHHPFFDEENGKTIYFEGTYTKWLSEGAMVPRYNYNQIMYQLNLEEEELNLPIAIYQLKTEEESMDYGLRASVAKDKNWEKIEAIPFFALEKPLKEEAVIPLYKFEEAGTTRLATSGQGQPFCYVISPEFDTDNHFIGNWECKINFASFNNFFAFELSRQGEEWTIRSQKNSFHLSNLNIEDGQLKMTLVQEGRTYTLDGKIVNGKLEGNFEAKSKGGGGPWGGPKGSWSGNKKEETWWAASTSAVVPLYEYFNPSTKKYVYSTQEQIQMKGFLRSDQPICRVWKNPYSTLILDYETQPIKEIDNL